MTIIFGIAAIILLFLVVNLLIYLLEAYIEEEIEKPVLKTGYDPADDDEIDYSNVKVKKLNNHISEVIKK